MKIVPSEQYPQRDQRALLGFLSLCREQAVAVGKPVLASITLKVEHIDPLAVLQSIYEAGERHFYLENAQLDEALAGAEAVLCATFDGEDRFVRAQAFIDETLSATMAIGDMESPFSGPHFFCGFTFAPAGACGGGAVQQPEKQKTQTPPDSQTPQLRQALPPAARNAAAQSAGAVAANGSGAALAGRPAPQFAEADCGAVSDFAPATVFVPRWQVARHAEGYTAVANILVAPQTNLRLEAARVLAAHAKFSRFDYTPAKGESVAETADGAPCSDAVSFADSKACDGATANSASSHPAGGTELPAVYVPVNGSAASSFYSAQPTTSPFDNAASPRPQLRLGEVGGEGHYIRAVAEALRRIESGRYEKIVLARMLDLVAEYPLHPLVALNRLRERYPSCYAFSFANDKGQSFIGSTPERLVRVEGGRFFTEALAGSAPRGTSAGEDARLGSGLLRNDKDLREHALVRKMILSRLAELGVAPASVPVAPRLRRLANLQHLWTPLGGELPAGRTLLELAARLHPTPAVGGAPCRAACADIPELEAAPRGLYSGLIGWVDARGNGEMVVALRSGLIEGSRARLCAGAGIVAGSDPQLEHAETVLKFRPLLNSL